MPKSLRPRAGGKPRGTPSRHSELPRALADDVRRAARPGDADRAIRRLARAVELLERDDPTAAIAEAEQSKALAGRSASVREVLGLAYYGAERWREALAELKAYRRISGRVDQNHLMADCQRALGRPGDAVPLVEEELRGSAPPEAKVEAVIVGASSLADQDRFAEALSFLRRARTRDDVGSPATLRLWYVRGDILERAGRPSEAADEFRRVVRHDAAAFDAAERLSALS